MKNPPFFIIGLPRSRTAWLANYFTQGDCFCWHEASRYCFNFKEFYERIVSTPAGRIGNADSNMVCFGDRLVEVFPDAKYLIVLRDFAQAAASYQKRFPDYGDKQKVEGVFNSIIANILLIKSKITPENCRELRFEEINPDNLEKISDWLGLPFSRQRAEMLDQMNVDTIPEKMEKNMHPAYQEVLKKVREDTRSKQRVSEKPASGQI